MKKIFSYKIFYFFLLLLASSKMNAQCPPGVQCNFLTKTGTILSANGAEISAFDPGSKRVYTVAGPVIEYHFMNNSGALSFGGSLPTGRILYNRSGTR